MGKQKIPAHQINNVLPYCALKLTTDQAIFDTSGQQVLWDTVVENDFNMYDAELSKLVAMYKFENSSADSYGIKDGVDTAITYGADYGVFGGFGALFNGTTSKIVIADNALLKPTGHFTIIGRIKTSLDDTSQIIFQSYSENTNRAGIYFQIYQNKLTLLVGRNNGTVQGTNWQFVQGATDITDGEWHTVKGQWDGSNLKVFVDDMVTADGTVAWAYAPAYAATNYVRIGTRNNSGTDGAGGQWFNGSMDEVMIFNGVALGVDASNLLKNYEWIPGGIIVPEDGVYMITSTLVAKTTADPSFYRPYVGYMTAVAGAAHGEAAIDRMIAYEYGLASQRYFCMSAIYNCVAGTVLYSHMRISGGTAPEIGGGESTIEIVKLSD